MTDGSVFSKRVVAAVSGAVLATVTVTPAEVVELPAASRATAVSVCDPSAAVIESQVMVYGVVVSSAPIGVPSTKNRTPATPTLSEALAVTGTVLPDTVDPAIGAVMATVGGVVSDELLVTSKASMT